MASDLEKRVRVKISTDSTGFNRSMKDINKDLRQSQSEFKRTGEEVKAFGKNTNRTKNQQQQLSKQVQLHTEKINLYKKSLEQSVKKLDEEYKTRDRLKIGLDQANKKYQECIKAYGEEAQETKKAKAELEKLTKEHEKNEKAIEVNTSKIKTFDTNISKAESQLIKTQGQLKKVTEELRQQDSKWIAASKSLEKYKDNMSKASNILNGVGNTLLAINAPLIGLGAGAVKVSMDFEKSMSNVSAVSGATGEDFKKLQDKAREMGANTSKSASNAADAMGYMALAGWKTQQMLEGIEPVLDLSVAGNMDLARTSDLVTDSMSALGITTKDLGGYLDKVAQTARNSNTNIDTLMEAFLACGGTANNLGIDTAELSAVLGVMANRGIKAAESGNSLNSILINLTAPVGQAKKALGELGISAFDIDGNFKGLEATLLEVKEKTAGLTEEKRNMYLAMIGGKEQSKALQAIISGLGEEYGDLEDKVRNSNGALNSMKEVMEDNFAGRVNELKSKIEELGLKFGETLLPMTEDAVEVLGKLVDSFASLPKETQEAIVQAVLLGTAVGGVSKVAAGAVDTVGTLAGGASKLAGWLGKGGKAAKNATDTVSGLGKASAVASGASGLGSLTGILTKIPSLTNPVVLGVGAVATAVAGVGYVGYKTLNDTGQQMDLFADTVDKTANRVTQAYYPTAAVAEESNVKISESTKKAVQSYLDLDKQASSALNSLFYNTTTITSQNSQSIIDSYSNMNNTVITKMQERHTKEYADLQAHFNNSNALTKEEEAKILANVKTSNANKVTEQNSYNAKIQEILTKAKNDKRALTDAEQKEINAIQEKMKTNAVKTLSDEEVESKIILERLKANAGQITKEQASEVIKNAETQRKSAVQKAEEQYKKTVANIIRMRDESKTISADQASKLIAEAEKQKTESIKKADEMKQGVLKKIEEQNKDMLKEVEAGTGNIKTPWSKFMDWWDKVFKLEPKKMTVTTEHVTVNRTVQGDGGKVSENWTGNRHFEGGYTTLHERGYEVYNLPKGTRIFNHEASADMVLKTAESVAEKVANRVLRGFNANSGSNGDINLNITSPTHLNPYEVARQTKQALRELRLQGR